MKEFRFRHFLSVRRILYWRWKLWKSQYFPRERLQALQWQLLSAILDHCFEHVPYYKRIFSGLGLKRTDFRSLDDLAKIPIMNKWILLDNYDDFKADNFRKFQPVEVYTSGTTGTSLKYYWDIYCNVLELTCQWRHFSWAGYRLGQPFADIRNKTINTPDGCIWNWQCRALLMSIVGINQTNIGQYAELLRKYKIKFWRGHPHAIHFLCLLLKEAGINDVKPNIIVISAEPVFEYQRQLMESYAGVPVCDNFGLYEHNALICQCPKGGYHIAVEYGIVEILREDGSLAQDGEEGRIVATGLHNRAMPLLRYDIGDYAVKSVEACSCGRTLPLIKNLTGRYVERILTGDGRWISEMRFPFKMGRNIRMAQFVQEKPGVADLYIVPDKGYSEEANKKMFDELRRIFSDSTTFRIHIVPNVPFYKSGKFKFVVNKLMTPENPANQRI